jgi:hypothetical protein
VFRRAWIVSVVVLVLAAPPVAASQVPRALLNPPFRLRTVDGCFFAAPRGATRWPLSPTGRVHAIQGSFNEPRGRSAHFGVDIPSHDQAPVYAALSGFAAGVRRHHLVVQTVGGTDLHYWHTDPVPGVVDATSVWQGELIGHVSDGMYHVHVGEVEPGCGWVNPMRPAGPFAVPANQEQPTIGGLHAYRATRSAFAAFDLETNPRTRTDPATAEPLAALHGVVDLRSRVYDFPTKRMTSRRQLPLMPAAIRAWLAPRRNRHRHLSRLKLIYDGARLLLPRLLGTTIFHIFAFGTWHQGIGYRQPGMPPTHVGADYVWHVGGTIGLHTARYPNGAYKYCVQALTINAIRGIRCTPVTIAN